MEDTIMGICYLILLLFPLVFCFILSYFINKQQNKIMGLEKRLEEIETEDFERKFDDYIREKVEEHIKIKNN